MGLPSGLVGQALMIVLIASLCWGMIIYLVWPEGCKRPPKYPKGQKARMITEDDLESDDQLLYKNYINSPSPKEKDPLLYCLLLYSHTASGDRAFSAERNSRIAFGFAVAVIIISMLRDYSTGLAHLAGAILLLLCGLAITRFVWQDRVIAWIRGRQNP